MLDPGMLAVRFALYVVLLALFGLYACALGSPAGRIYRPAPWLAVTATLLGLLLSLLALLLIVAGMAALPLAQIDSESIRAVLAETPAGKAIAWRAAFLLLILPLAWRQAPGRRRLVALGALSAEALTTVAWTGHGAATEGAVGLLHLGADIVHLLAAAIWLGALFVFLRLLFGRGADPIAIHAALARFSTAGIALVASILLSGLINAWVMVGPAQIAMLPTTLYGRLLLVKLALFAAMVGFAAANRMQLTPALARAMTGDDSTRALRALKVSIALETAAALLILAVVAWLGMVDPLAAM
jgi:putative copper resistance protein D